ncbi:MAG: methyltransferase domain-containing protein [Nitrososphaerota archaeon]|nr:methyltransferase domain-containing protein [Nitrososphaerota archaeon]MDG6937385.1 methyltransferase domain-containing protein [Nitrososphaerota archaeon]MDG6952424.1 methyltransferase domain-containing protein [Nitrososphaerota archaeon]MDG6958744.1 methyltransferase domain-containing protein [Nitrososphaerota archaeon]MDG6961701.1 methyltransferase domain-containing protein [Nitrososphaerota archaeon]
MGAPFYPTSAFVVEKMLALAGVNSESVVYDLGCGDGAIVVAAARNYNATKVVGIEQKQKLCSIALRKTRHLGNVTIVNANYDDVDISEANVVTLYQSSSENARLKRKLVGELREGSKVVSHDFGIPGWRPTEFRVLKEGHHNQRILVYVIGSNTPL